MGYMSRPAAQVYIIQVYIRSIYSSVQLYWLVGSHCWWYGSTIVQPVFCTSHTHTYISGIYTYFVYVLHSVRNWNDHLVDHFAWVMCVHNNTQTEWFWYQSSEVFYCVVLFTYVRVLVFCFFVFCCSVLFGDWHIDKHSLLPFRILSDCETY